MRIPLERTSPIPLYRQIKTFLQQQIESGALPPETRLPASRTLAASLGVNRITVSTAYAELEADGLVYSKPGSGTFVALPLTTAPGGGKTPLAAEDWPLWQQELLSRSWLPVQRELAQLRQSVHRQDLISFADGVGAEDLFPVHDFRRALRDVLRRDGAEALGYGDPAGYAPLRATIAGVLSSDGTPTHADQVLITSGSQQALALTAHLLLRPGDVVLVESPTYTGAIDLFRSLDVRLLGIPMDEQGMQVDRVEEALHAARPRLIYTIPTYHNPTGLCMSNARKRQLLALADRYNVPILEDDFAGALRYEGRAQPTLKTLDPGGRVIYAGTFSKILRPGMRVGFLVASGPVYERLLACKRTLDLATATLIQRALERYITVGRYQAFVRRACRTYRRRRDAMLEALARHLPPDVQWTRPQGGLFIWVQLPEAISARALYPVAGEEGVLFTPGSVFFPGERAQPYLRLNCVVHPPEVIEEGIRRLGRAIERYRQLQGARDGAYAPAAK